MRLTELPQIQSLSVREKLELVDELWKSVSPALDLMETTQAEMISLDDRWSDFLQNPSSAITIDHFKKELAALRE